jgi:hypothetical protein
MSAQSLVDAGYTVAQGVRITWPDAKGAYSVIDAIGTKEVDGVMKIVLSEAKDGMFSKLSTAQKTLFAVAFDSGKLIVEDPKVATRLSIRAGVPLAAQGNLIIAVDASAANGRAMAQFARIALSKQRGFFNIGTFFANPRAAAAVGVGAVYWSILLHMPSTGGCHDGRCTDTFNGR